MQACLTASRVSCVFTIARRWRTGKLAEEFLVLGEVGVHLLQLLGHLVRLGKALLVHGGELRKALRFV